MILKEPSIKERKRIIKGKVYNDFQAYCGRVQNKKIMFFGKTRDAASARAAAFLCRYKSADGPLFSALSRQQVIDALNALEVLAAVGNCRASLTELAREELKRRQAMRSGGGAAAAGCATATLSDVYAKFIKCIPVEQVRNIGTHRSLARCLMREIPGETLAAELSVEMFVRFLNKYKNPVTRNSKHARLRAVMNWAVRNGFASQNPLSAIDAAPESYKEPAFFLPEKVEGIMRVVEADADVDIAMVFVLGFFAGLRSSEIARARWEDIDIESGAIRIPRPKGATQGVRPRIVELEQNAIAWIKRFSQVRFLRESRAQRDDLVVPVFWKLKEWKRAHLVPLSLSWGNDANHNVMRHTYATMHVAAFRNAPATALNLGHGRSQEMLDRHYKGLIPRTEAEKYWRILPKANPAMDETSGANNADDAGGANCANDAPFASHFAEYS